MEKENQEEQEHLENQKTLENKNIIERHTLDGKFNLGTALQDLDNKIKRLDEITYNLHNAMEFMTAWYEQNAKNNLQEVDKPKIELL